MRRGDEQVHARHTGVAQRLSVCAVARQARHIEHLVQRGDVGRLEIHDRDVVTGRGQHLRGVTAHFAGHGPERVHQLLQLKRA